METGSPKQDDVLVRLNVGGKIFSTTRARLESTGSNMLSALVKNTTDGIMTTTRDEDGNIFIDRNPEAFGAILEYLRTGVLSIPINLSWEHMEVELDFYCINRDSIEPAFDGIGTAAKLLNDVEVSDENLAQKLWKYSKHSQVQNAKDWVQRNRVTIVQGLTNAAKSGVTHTEVKICDSEISAALRASRKNRIRHVRQMTKFAKKAFPVIDRLYTNNAGYVIIVASWSK